MSVILGIDTSTNGFSVALFSEHGVIHSIDFVEEKSAASLMASTIENVCIQAHINLHDISAVAVCKGPGSYTGLRVGVSSAKGLCMALDIPLISFESLEVLAYQGKDHSSSYIIPMIDARRNEVFTKVYNAELCCIEDTSAKIVDSSSFLNYLQTGTCLFLGNGSQKCKDIITHPNARFLEEPITTSAKFGFHAVLDKFTKKEFEDLTHFEPFYLKEYMFKVK
ncbi:MAG: tRNA (adenosine(37)-N6)-threonylcarbamoyltransferase complex dimerization subunit type 1 TsaB [Leadbetterella sp.]